MNTITKKIVSIFLLLHFCTSQINAGVLQWVASFFGGNISTSSITINNNTINGITVIGESIIIGGPNSTLNKPFIQASGNKIQQELAQGIYHNLAVDAPLRVILKPTENPGNLEAVMIEGDDTIIPYIHGNISDDALTLTWESGRYKLVNPIVVTCFVDYLDHLKTRNPSTVIMKEQDWKNRIFKLAVLNAGGTSRVTIRSLQHENFKATIQGCSQVSCQGTVNNATLIVKKCGKLEGKYLTITNNLSINSTALTTNINLQSLNLATLAITAQGGTMHLAGTVKDAKVEGKMKLATEKLSITNSLKGTLRDLSEAAFWMLAAQVIKLDIDSSRNIECKGTCEQQEVNVSNVSTYKARDLVTKEATIRAMSTSKAIVYVTKKLTADAFGVSSITYYGNPAEIEKHEESICSCVKPG